MATDHDALIARLNLRAKVRLLTGRTSFTLHGEPAIGLAPMAYSDGPTGVRGLKFTGGDRVALFPNATLLASSWDPDLLAEVGDALGEEAERQHINVVLGPTINLHRSALGGRLFEQYSEDPLLTGVLASAYVRALQAHGVGACLKHLVANESETERNFVDCEVPQKALRECYLLPFEIATADAGPWTMMAAYNDVNGVPATEHQQVQNVIVKGEWGFDGQIMSDWYAASRTVETANGGLDLVMPGPGGPWEDHLVAAVESGEVAEDVVDDHVRRLLRLAGRAGMLGGEREWADGVPAPDSRSRREQLTRFAAAGMTVLRNEGGVLPLDPGAQVALIGRHAVATTCMGGGSARVNAPHQVSIADGLRDRVPVLSVVDGVEVRLRAVPAEPGFLVDPTTGTAGMEVVLLDAGGAEMTRTHADETLVSVGWEDDTPRPAAGAVLRGTVTGGGRLDLGVIGVGSWTLRVGDTTLEQTLTVSGADPGEALLNPPFWHADADVAPGALLEARVDFRPPGMSARPTGKPQIDAMLASPSGMRGLIARPLPPPADRVLADAAAAARDADVAVVVVGTTDEQETEASDKETLRLPGDQDALVEAVAGAARATVVVVNAATPVLMPWEDEVDAVIVIGLPGQEGGHAVAAALLGEQEPAGRLVTTWPAADGAAPAWDVAPTGGTLTYAEGTFVGYRGHRPYGLAPEPAHWFGEGLGYGSWEYGEPSMDAAGTGAAVRVPVTNTGRRASREVVQVYLRPASTDEPVRLVGWAGVTVPAGETATAHVACDERLWRRWDEEASAWSSLPGGGELLIARGLGDVRGRIELG